ncbi:hypothetical protein HW132_02200 [Brasilonema sp. CT11]|nr:hypothetical protein [Brasilonema sp. CT11]
MNTRKSTKEPDPLKPKVQGLTYAEQQTRKLRIAAYVDEGLLAQLDDWCKQNNKDRGAAMRYIMRTMLNIQDNADDTAVNQCISILEELTDRIRLSNAI